MDNREISMNSDELAASIGRHINGILDDVASYAAEQVALATREPEPEPMYCASCLWPMKPGENCPRCPLPDWARKAEPKLVSSNDVARAMRVHGVEPGRNFDGMARAIADVLNQFGGTAAPPEDAMPEAARREVSVTGARIEQRRQDDTTSGYHRDGKRCGFTQPTAQNTP